MKKYLKMLAYILGIMLIITILAIASKEILKSYADTPTKEATVSKVTYEFEAEDINSTEGIAHNLRIKSREGTSTTLSIPASLKVDNITYKVNSIGNEKESALGNTTGWKEIKIPAKSVETINANAFRDCTTLETVTFLSTSSCTTIGDYAFYGCTKLKNIKANTTSNRIQASVTTIGDYAFYNCDSLVKLDLYTGVKTLGENTFKGTTPLTELTIRSDIEKHSNAFKGHTGITKLIFNGKLATTIYDSMFEGCTGLTNVTQTNYIISIGDRAFYGCTGLGGHGLKTINSSGKQEDHKEHHITYSLNPELKVGKDAYRFAGFAEGVTELPTIDIEQIVDKADVDYYTNGIGKVTMNISSTDVQKTNPKDYIVCIDTTSSMDTKTKAEAPKKDKDGNDVLDKNGNVVMVKRTRMEIAREALQLLANRIYEENPENRLAIITQKGSSYVYMDFLDGSHVNEVNKLIEGMTTSSRGNAEYGNSSSWYPGVDTNYKTGLLTMADIAMERKTERNRSVYGIFISDGYPNNQRTYIKGAAAHVQSVCEAVWSVSIALQIDDATQLDPPDTEERSEETQTFYGIDAFEQDNAEQYNTVQEEIEIEEEIDQEEINQGNPDPEEPDPEDPDPADDWEEEEIDENDKGRYLKYIRTYWGHTPLFFDFPDDGELETKFKKFMQSIVDVSVSSLADINFESKLNTDIWEFYTGTDYVNSEGFEIKDSQNATFKFERVGKDKQQYYYYIRLKDDKRDKTDPQLLVSDELTAEYTISGGKLNGEDFNKENGKNALYDTPLYLDWKTGDDPTPPDDTTPPDDPTPPVTLRPGKLEITKTGEVLIKIEQEEDGRINPIYEEQKIQGAEFEVYAKEDIYEIANNGNISAQPDEIDTGETDIPEQQGEQETKLLYAKDTLVKRILTGEQGKAELENLPIGKYYVREVKAGEGFVLNQEIKEFEIVNQGEDKSIQKVEIVYKNERQKVNLNGKEGLLVEKTADKKLYESGEEVIYTIKITNTTQTIIRKILVKETMIQGKFEDISTDNVVKGDDLTVGIRELKPGESVELKFIANIGNVSEKQRIENKIEAIGTVEVSDPENPGNTIEKEIKGAAEEEIYLTNKQLNIIKEALKDEYEVGETVQYIIKVMNNGITDITDVVVEEKMLNGKFVYIEEANQGGADIKLVDNQKVTISKIEPGKMITLRYEYEISKDTKVTVDEEQRIILGNKVTVKGKTEEPDPRDPDATISKDLEDEDTEEVEIKTNPEGSGLGIIKIDLETGKTIQGAVIGLYAAENIKGSNGEDIIARDTLIEKVTTDENGKAKYTVDLPLGKYYLKEIEAPEKYMLSEEKIEIDATYRGQEIEVINVNKTITNRKTILDFSLDKRLISISVDGENIPIKDNKLVKLEIKTSNIKKANIIANYKIKVKNKVNMAGKVKVLEIVPKGYEVVNTPEYWKVRPDGILETEVSLEGNESKELDISLKWINDEENLGSGTNKAKLETDDYTNTDDDDSQATIIVSVKTGEIVSAIIIIMIIASLGIAGYMTSQIISKMRKGPDIEGINFLKNKNK